MSRDNRKQVLGGEEAVSNARKRFQIMPDLNLDEGSDGKEFPSSPSPNIPRPEAPHPSPEIEEEARKIDALAEGFKGLNTASPRQ